MLQRKMIAICGFCMLFAMQTYGFRHFGFNHRYHRTDINGVIADHKDQAHADFLPDFEQAGVSYPPKKLALLVFKEEKDLELWANDGKRWVFIRNIDILAASGRPGPKLRSGDFQVPEGIYKISALNPFSHYDLSLMINYPDAYDKVHAQLDHRHDLGGNIFIHGGHVSIGCIAIGDHFIEDLFVLVYEVGVDNVKVIIAPNDLRIGPPAIARRHPKWVDDLEYRISTALKQFPVPPESLETVRRS